MAELHPQPEDETVFYTYWILLVFILNAIFSISAEKKHGTACFSNSMFDKHTWNGNTKCSQTILRYYGQKYFSTAL